MFISSTKGQMVGHELLVKMLVSIPVISHQQLGLQVLFTSMLQYWVCTIDTYQYAVNCFILVPKGPYSEAFVRFSGSEVLQLNNVQTVLDFIIQPGVSKHFSQIILFIYIDKVFEYSSITFISISFCNLFLLKNQEYKQ